MASETVRQEYDRLAADYDERWGRYIDATLRAAVEGVRLRGNERVLDVPCGTGELEQRLLRRWPGLTVFGMDLSGAMLRRAAAKRLTAHWTQADVHRLPAADESFDAVICANSFHYFRRPSEALAEIRRVLRPGGSLLLVDWCDDYIACKLCSLWLRWSDPAFVRTYALPECRALLTRSGFEVVQAERFRAGLLWGLMRLNCRRVG